MASDVSAPPAERYVDARELAEMMHVSVRTIRRMTAAGMPSETWGMGHVRRYLPSRAIGWASDRATIGAVNPTRPRASTDRAEHRRRQDFDG